MKYDFLGGAFYCLDYNLKSSFSSLYDLRNSIPGLPRQYLNNVLSITHCRSKCQMHVVFGNDTISVKVSEKSPYPGITAVFSFWRHKSILKIEVHDQPSVYFPI